jgi:hypothetical protein
MNKLQDLNDALFEAIDRLNSEELDNDMEKMLLEISRSRALAMVGNTIVGNARLMLEGQKVLAEFRRDAHPVLPQPLVIKS